MGTSIAVHNARIADCQVGFTLVGYVLMRKRSAWCGSAEKRRERKDGADEREQEVMLGEDGDRKASNF